MNTNELTTDELGTLITALHVAARSPEVDAGSPFFAAALDLCNKLDRIRAERPAPMQPA